MADSSPIFPRAVKQAGPADLENSWSDGHASIYPVAYLRRSCRCAACVDELSGRQILDPLKVPEEVRPVEITPVGRYALNIAWTDGHRSGIYTFEYLRSLCPCEECRAR